MEEIQAFKPRYIRPRYSVKFYGASFLSIKRYSISKETVYIVIGITEERYEDVLHFQTYNTESPNNYRDIFQILKAIKLENVLPFVSDELPGLKDALAEELLYLISCHARYI